MDADQSVFRFGRFALDRRRREFFVDGKHVPLDEKAVRVLEFLIEHRESQVSREDIQAYVWPDVIVTENSLAVQVFAVRQALDKGGGKRLILTQGRSYRFVGDLDPPPVPEAARALPAEPATLIGPIPDPPVLVDARPVSLLPRWRAASVFAAAALIIGAVLVVGLNRVSAPAAPPLSIVVLPFRDESKDQSLGPLADRVTDDLNDDLAHVPRSLVIGRSSAVKHRDDTPQQIGSELNVRYVLEGSVGQTEDGQYHVAATLTEAKTARVLWTARVERPRDQLSDLRMDVIGKIASQLHLELDDIESSKSLLDRPKNPNELDLFFQANHILDWGDSLSAFQDAQGRLERAVLQQPDFADAQAELGWMLLRKVETFDDPDEAEDLGKARGAISLALKAAPQNAGARVALSRELQMDGKCDEAVPIASQIVAVEQSNLDARTVIARCAQFEPDLEKAADQYRIILRLDPDSPRAKLRHLALGTVLLVQGHTEEAIGQLQQCIEEFEPSDYLVPAEQCRLVLLAAYDLNHQAAKARKDYSNYASQNHGRTVWRFSAYFPGPWAALRGFIHLQQALRDAGMEAFADEAAPGLPVGAPCPSGDFAPTPTSLGQQGEVISTPTFVQRLANADPVVIDVGRGIAVMPSWLTYASARPAESQTAFAVRSAAEHSTGGVHKPIIVLGDGITGCSAYDAALVLIHTGYTDVAWYRGGEEAWARYIGKQDH